MSRRLAVILAADLVDYSRMMEEDEDAAIALIRELRDRSLEPVVAAHGGEVLKRMGDGWIIAFGEPDAAIACLVETQKGLAPHPRIRLRMGVHMGEIVEDEADFYGAGVNLAARLQTEAPPGGALISADLHGRLPDGLASLFSDAGTFRLKNIAQPVNGFQWRPGGTLPAARADEVPVIAVEPFAAAPDDGATRSAADDIREQIVLGLSRRSGVRVRDAALGENRAAIYALRGRLRNSGGRARLNLSLALISDGSNVWSGAFDGDSGDLFEFCDRVAGRADAQLRLQINALDGERIADLPDDALSCSELRARAATSFYGATIRSWKRSEELLGRALRLNPDDPMALAMRAEAEVFLSVVRHRDLDAETVARLTADVDRALEATPRSDYFHCVRAHLRCLILGDADGALADVSRCNRINPNYAYAFENEGYALMLKSEFADAVGCIAAVLNQLPDDPLNPYRIYFMAIAQFCAGDHAAAAGTAQGLIDLKPGVRAYRALLALVREAAGDAAGAAAAQAAALDLPNAQTFHAPRPPLPEDWRWLADALAPGAP